MVKFLGVMSGFNDIANAIFGEPIKILQIKESPNNVEFHLQVCVNGVKFNTINKFNTFETGRTIVLFGSDDDEFVAEKTKFFPADF